MSIKGFNKIWIEKNSNKEEEIQIFDGDDLAFKLYMLRDHGKLRLCIYHNGMDGRKSDIIINHL